MNKLGSLSFVAMLALVGCASSSTDADSAGTTTADVKAPAPVDLSALTNAMTKEAQGFDSGTDGCSFTADATSKGLTLKLNDGKGTKVTLDVTKSDVITYKDKPDGDSSTESYAIEGVGTVAVLHADDAFEQVTLSAKGGKTASCEIDF